MILRKDSYVSPGSLQVSYNSRIACFEEVVELPGKAPEPPRYHILDLGSGKEIEAGEGVKGATSCKISGDGKWAALEGDGLRLVSLATFQSTRIAEEMSGGFWMGSKLLIVSFRAGGSGRLGLVISALKVYDPTSGKTENWELAGLPLASDPEGKFLLVATDQRSPQRDFDPEGTNAMICVDSNGRINEAVGPFFDCSSTPVISPLCKWIAFQSRPKDAGEAKEKGNKIVLFDVDRKRATSIEESVVPIGVTDSGTVVLLGESAWLQGSPIRLYSHKDGIATGLVERAFGATVANNKVYYVTGRGETARLVWIDLPSK